MVYQRYKLESKISLYLLLYRKRDFLFYYTTKIILSRFK